MFAAILLSYVVPDSCLHPLYLTFLFCILLMVLDDKPRYLNSSIFNTSTPFNFSTCLTQIDSIWLLLNFIVLLFFINLLFIRAGLHLSGLSSIFLLYLQITMSSANKSVAQKFVDLICLQKRCISRSASLFAQSAFSALISQLSFSDQTTPIMSSAEM